MPRSSTDLLSRVKKLLALSTSTNVHEAAAAAAAAQKLIDAHQLETLLAADAGDDDDPISDGREAPIETARRPRRWRFVLADGLARENGGQCWSVHDDVGTHTCFCGRPSDRDVTAALFEVLATRIEWLSASQGAGKSRHWHEAFRVGAAETIIERLAAGDDEPMSFETTAALQKTAPLRAARQAAVERYIDAHLRLGPGRGFSVDARGYAKGKVAGRSVPLRHKPR